MTNTCRLNLLFSYFTTYVEKALTRMTHKGGYEAFRTNISDYFS